MKKMLFLVVVLFVFSKDVIANENTAEKLFGDGYLLYQQKFAGRALEKFKDAANLGHVEAAYYAANIIRQDYTYINEESEHYYRQAANGGDVYAMLRLAQNDTTCGILRDCDYDGGHWLEQAMRTAHRRAESGDSDAMLQLFSVYWMKDQRSKAFDWTKKAAEHGNAFAQYWLAVGLIDEREMGFYWTDSSRRKDVLKWLEASAERGFPKAMLTLATEYARDGRGDEAVKWIDRMGQTDYFDALYEYGLLLIDGPTGDEGFLQYPEIKSIEGLAMLFALHRETGNSAVGRSIERRLPEMDPEVVEKARVKAEELLIDTPILHYLPKFGI
ncbi:MAG: tetratricopeptide repeat protein [Pseudomonadota bacterium]|nr:tetratricopeptide repeat protein [Pseudomonadota bacterium]